MERGETAWDILYVRRLYFQFKKKKESRDRGGNCRLRSSAITVLFRRETGLNIPVEFTVQEGQKAFTPVIFL